jgi:16S rRNA (adenine1518-N6/adenine1519-N6)-dimethyltransferase
MENESRVRAKKSLGQHFLKDQNIAQKIVDALKAAHNFALEIGPGMGVLTQYLIKRPSLQLRVSEIDRESVAYLEKHFPALTTNILQGDFLELKLDEIADEPYAIIGNFPYNISSQIFFHILTYRSVIDEVVCMLQKEVADRIASPPGNKTYGILSVLLQTFYDIEYLIKVSPGVFSPPPKVMSAVIRLQRNNRKQLPCSEKLFFQVVKQGFNNRRKTLRNALKNLNLAASVSTLALLDKRAEQLSVEDFIHLTKIIEDSRAGTATHS